MCIRHGGGHTTGIPLHLLQQSEYLLPLSLSSLIQVFNRRSSFFIWCLCNSFIDVIHHISNGSPVTLVCDRYGHPIRLVLPNVCVRWTSSPTIVRCRVGWTALSPTHARRRFTTTSPNGVKNRLYGTSLDQCKCNMDDRNRFF